MKSPAELFRIGLVWGTLLLTAAQLVGQEVGSATKASAVNLAELPQLSGAAPSRTFRTAHKRLQQTPRNLPVTNTAQPPEQRRALASPQSLLTVEPQTLPILSPPPSLSFLALPDNGEVAPPDTFGAVGPLHLVVACASEMRVSDRSGNVISTLSQEHFWTNVARNIFDTRVVYDPYGGRFIMTAAADPGGPNPRLCIAVSSSSNPTAPWYRWSEDVDATSPVYADSPTLGFNKTWIVVQANMYDKTTHDFVRSQVYAYNKANLYANGTGQRTVLSFDASLGSSQMPATMYDTNSAVVYFAQNWNGNVLDTNDFKTYGFLRLYSLVGGIGSERLNLTNSFGVPIYARIGKTWGESAINDMDILPQLGSTNKIYAGDSRIQNTHFRDGVLYLAHTVFLPAAAPTRAAAQWWAVTATAEPEIRNFGRVDDESGTNMFAYPSIAANRYHDVLLGYSRFSSNEYPSVAYSFRQDTDTTDELRGEVLLKAGEAAYNELISGQNRWGDWSATTVDVNDNDLWTIQQYAAPPVPGHGRWGTWWGRVSPPTDMAIIVTDAPDPVPTGNQITYTLRVTNKQDKVLSNVRVQSILPPDATYVSSTTTKGNCSHANGVLSCTMSGFIERQSETITLTVVAGAPGFATNTATVIAAGPDVQPSDNTAITVTEVINSADLQVQGTDSPDPVHVGNTLTYTLTISNRGPSAAAGVVMTSTLPASVTLGTITAIPGAWTTTGNQIAFTFGSINNGGTALITIACTPNTAGMITNELRLAANTFDPAPGNNALNIATRVNARPVINQIDTQIINEDVATAIPITISDAENPAANLALSAVSSNQDLIPNSNIVPSGSGQNRTLTVTSAPNQFGSNTTTITVTVTDLDGASSTMTFPVDVAAVNDRPTISDITDAAMNEDTSISLNFNVGDIDTPVSALTLSANSSAPALLPIENIQLSGNTSLRTVALYPATNRFGTSTVTVTVSDGSLTRSDTFLLTVNPVNDPPMISEIGRASTDEGTPTPAIAFTVSDPETPATNLTVTATSGNTMLVPNANLALENLGSDRTIRVTPAANQHGSALITVRVSDGTNAVTTPLELTVRPVNDPPTLAQPTNITTNEDAGIITVALTGIGSGAPNESQTLSLRASTSTPDLVENLQISYNSPEPNGTLTFQTVTNASGIAFIDIVVSDGDVADDVTRRLQVTLSAVNDAPTIDLIDDVTVPEDSGQRVMTLTGITAGDPSEVGQTVSITATSSAPAVVPNPQINYTSPDSTATLRFTPVANANGPATITVTADDGRTVNPTTVRTFRITVSSSNDMPTISFIGDRTIAEDASTGTITFNVADVEPGTLTVSGFSSDQALVPDANVAITGAGGTRNLTVSPRANEFGEAMITVRVADSEGGATNQTFRLTVNPVNDLPTLAAISDPNPIDEDPPAQTVNLSGISPGPSNESTQTLTITATSSNPSIVPHPVVNYTFPNTTGSLTYTPTANATGSVVITVTVDDLQASNNTTSRTFTVKINAVNDPPMIAGDFEPRFSDEDVQVDISFTIGDIETPVGSLTLRGTSSNAELVADTNITFSGSGDVRTVTVRPLTNEFGFTVITLTVTDGGGAATEVAFDLNVSEVNDRPTLNPINDIVLAKNPPAQTVPLAGISAGAAESQPLSITATSSVPNLVSHPTVSYTDGNSTGTLGFTVAPNSTGAATISVRVSDGVDNITRSFTVNIVASNFPPVFLTTIPPLTTAEDTPIGAAFRVVDEATYSAQLTLTATSTNTTLVPNANIVFHGSDSDRWVAITPAPNLFGLTRITITANDGTNSTPMTFDLTVTSSNDPPTLNVLTNIALISDPPNQTINLSGIGSGAPNENQTLSIRVTSSNPTLVPVPGTITYTSPNPTGSFVLNPANSGTGSALITVTVWDNGSPSNSFTRAFTVYVRSSGNSLPTITGLSNRGTPEDTSITIPFTVGDSVTPAANLVVGALSSNSSVVSTNGIEFGGAGANRSMTITPLPERSGSSTITVWVLDTQFGYASANFTLQVTNVNDAPMISSIPPQTINVNSSLPPVPFAVSDAETAPQSLTLAATSSNQGLLPNSRVILGGSGTNRSVFAYPMSNQTGSATITITVTDGNALSTSTNFLLTVSLIRPTLVIRRSGLNVDLLWPTAAGTYTLQGRDQLTTGDWADIMATPTVDGTNYVVSQPISGIHRFFRLRN